MDYRGLKGLNQAMRNSSGGVICASGILDGQTAFACAELCRHIDRQILILVSSFDKIRSMHAYLDCFSEGRSIYVFPDDERSFFHYDARSRVHSHQSIKCLKKAMEESNAVFIATAMAASRGLCSPEIFRQSFLKLERGMQIDGDLREKLTDLGYERVSMTESQGQFSVRGGIVDVFPPGEDYPLRIDLFDVEVDDIKTYDPLTQRSVKNLNEAVIAPAVLSYPDSQEDAFYLIDYFDENALIAADDWQRICGQLDIAQKEMLSVIEMSEENRLEHMEIFASADRLAQCLSERNALVTAPFAGRLKYLDRQAALVDMNCMQSATFSGRMDLFREELTRLSGEGYEISVVCSTEERMKNIRDFMIRSEMDRTVHVELSTGSIPSGMYFIADRQAVFSDGDIFRSVKKKRKRRHTSGERKMAVFADFNEGDYVVHENHGIGRFTGIKPMMMDGKRRDYICISYAGSDMLYVPVEHMNLVQPYIGSGGDAPRVNRLSTPEWSRTKEKARLAIERMAEDIVRLSAQRRLKQGHSFNIDSSWQRQFDEMFPYVETEDQLRCIDEIRGDMADICPMDRLLCGDVGFGKTEVAARAVFTCVMDGKQAAILVPTTILADQHFRTFKERFEKFPVTIEMVSRFRSEADQKRALNGLADGSVDIIIGTHRLLSEDVKFSDLGLLVVDEEQRFGVQHKEKIKMMKETVDVLSISATPIPRTLHMSMSGIRSLSTLQEPPEERYPVQTFVMEQDDNLIREVIMREIGRGGEVFVVFNRIKGINIIADRISSLVPDARVVTAHGRMNENRLEDVMSAFIDGEYDVLVATTIIESGIDIKAANTLIILDSDRYGLAQLYQLRGRVGRSNVPAYAYLMYQKDKVLSEVASRRLRAIMQFTEFGSGFRVAMKDMEIRGAGNLIGTEQSGHMMNIGYELYCKMVDEAVRRLKGEKVADTEQEVLIDLHTDAFIPSEYISDESLKLDIYKRISGIANDRDMSDVTDELIDRFGDIPAETINLMKVSKLKFSAGRAGISRISLEGGAVRMEFHPKADLKPENFLRLSSVYKNSIVINITSRKPFVRMPLKNRAGILDDIQNLLNVLNDV